MEKFPKFNSNTIIWNVYGEHFKKSSLQVNWKISFSYYIRDLTKIRSFKGKTAEIQGFQGFKVRGPKFMVFPGFQGRGTKFKVFSRFSRFCRHPVC